MTKPVNKEVEEKKEKKSFTQLRYPLTPGEHNIVLLFREYSYDSTQSGFVRKPSVPSNLSTGVTLPIPENLTDNYSVKVGPYELGLAGALTVDALTNPGTIATDMRNAVNSVMSGNLVEGAGDAVSSALSTFKQASAFAGRNLLDAIPGGGGISAGIDIAGGTTINPHVALKFDGIDLKQHTFNWKLSPRNVREAEQIKKITTKIKQAMLPNYKYDGESALSNSLLEYPMIVDIFFTGIDQSYFYYFKPVMINTFTTDYSPNGLALNKGGKPAFINMTLTCTEAQIHTRDDITNLYESNASPF